MKNSNVTNTLVDRAREMRREPTEEEGKLWHLYLKKITPRFVRQKIIECYIVDFYCPKLMLIIEVDGEQHYLGNGVDYDIRRDKILTDKGYRILRFYNSDINKNLSNTESTIYQTCVDRIKELGLDVEFSFKNS